MKTLILNGSPRKNGDTVGLINLLRERLSGDVFVFSCYYGNVAACIDCRYCWEKNGCCINDGWQQLDAYIRECDNIILASPINFSELTGQLLAVMSRAQAYWCARFFRKHELIPKTKRGGIILVGGGDGQMNIALKTASTLLHQLRCTDIADPVICHNTNKIAAVDEPGINDEIERLAGYINSGMI